MALLRKIKGSTLMETLVATVLIVVIFMISSLILNNFFLSFSNGNNRELENHLRTLEYNMLYNTEKQPYYETYKDWEIELIKKTKNKDSIIYVSAKNIKTNKIFIKEKIIE